MSTTTDPKDPRLTHGVDTEPTPMAEVYLVLSDEDRAKGYVRPLRRSYVHVGFAGPVYPTAPLTKEQQATYEGADYVAYEAYPEDRHPVMGRFWTQAQLDNIGKGCGAVTTMNEAIAATYARDPSFYGATYCARCQQHLMVGADGEFVWDGPYDPATGVYSTPRVGA